MTDHWAKKGTLKGGCSVGPHIFPDQIGLESLMKAQSIRTLLKFIDSSSSNSVGRETTCSAPSPSVEWILAHRHTPQRHSQELTLDSLYRIYEYIVYGHMLGLRTEIEFFNHSDWKVAEIPDPVDSDLKRYVIIPVIPHLLVKAFNRLIERGLPRDAPAIIMGDEHFDELADRPRILEMPPEWCARVPKLDETLVIPDKGGRTPDEAVASAEFKKKNVLVSDLHVLFV
ncbi:hypothetical protein AJ80_05243 [Polytolypa hystricis UAMH7299]|uniref:Uncharacterized protein n=1 Tax=Polytolypa hystricis (strain UAMH7299) TaxID=1447883 RepID=A0A2B7Y4Q8_POLH7|nr:hypothetical protein AJ80_05243 [Polytolypa hystricis UAMH7299]